MLRIPRGCSFENFFPSPENLSTLLLHPFTTPLLLGRSQVSSQSLWVHAQMWGEILTSHLRTPERAYFTETFFLIDESESSFHISLHNIYIFFHIYIYIYIYETNCFAFHHVNILQFHLTSLSQMDTYTIIFKKKCYSGKFVYTLRSRMAWWNIICTYNSDSMKLFSTRAVIVYHPTNSTWQHLFLYNQINRVPYFGF